MYKTTVFFFLWAWKNIHLKESTQFKVHNPGACHKSLRLRNLQSPYLVPERFYHSRRKPAPWGSHSQARFLPVSDIWPSASRAYGKSLLSSSFLSIFDWARSFNHSQCSLMDTTKSSFKKETNRKIITKLKTEHVEIITHTPFWDYPASHQQTPFFFFFS